MRALIVDDSTAYRELVLQVAVNIGLEATGIETAEEALTLCSDTAFDLMIIDLNLGGMDGLEFCRQVRNNTTHSLTPIILLTADQDTRLQQRAFDAGFSEVILKTDAAPLLDALQAFVDRIAHKMSGRVLYIEDSKAVAGLTLSYLRKAGLDVDHFTAADAALEYFEQHAFDLIISDVVVEGSLSGIGLLRAIRMLPDERRNTPFLALSGAGNALRKVLALRQGADDFIDKPVHREELLARAANLIAKQRLMEQVLAQQEELRLRSITDELTGLYNKAYLNANGRQTLASGQRHRFPVSIMVIDLDHFKRINDEHGHDVGDKVLQAVGEALRHSARSEDLVARFGGEEFVFILPHCTLSNARKKAEELREKLISLKPQGIDITSSFGINCTKKDETLEYEEFFKQADQAVYAAKNQGRNCVVSFTPALTTAHES